MTWHAQAVVRSRTREGPFRPSTSSVRFSIAANVKPRPITSYRPPSCASAQLSHGLLLLFEVGVRPPHDGMRRMGRPNLSGALAAD